MKELAFGTNKSIKIKNCQVCNSDKLEEIVSLGHLPQVNVMQSVGEDLQEETFFPVELLLCANCSLAQLSHIVDPKVIFPPSYAYTTRTTKILRENFAQLAEEVKSKISIFKDDLIVDIGSNDGTLLSNFNLICKVMGVEPTDVAKYANEHNIPTMQSFFNEKAANIILTSYSSAKVITATNCFAHIEDIHSIIDSIKLLMNKDGMFINENHYLISLMQTNQYDTLYHEHLRYYSLTSLKYLFEMHNMEIFDAKLIPTHGGSIRVYTANKGQFPISDNVKNILEDEKKYLTKSNFKLFKNNIVKSKCDLYELLNTIDGSVGAIGAPSRACTLVNYIGLNEDILDFILEAPGSSKNNKYMPGTKIKILEETIELLLSVDNLLLLSWHIADEIIPKLKEKGFKGSFIIPLPFPKVIK